MLVAPAAWTVLPELPRILGLFRSRGVRAFVPVLPYADISAWVYYRLIAEEPGGVFLSSACVGMNRYIARKHPRAAPARMVYSPLLSAARYLKTYGGAPGSFAFLSPCSQKCLEFSVRGEELVRYNITIAALSRWLSTATIDLRRYQPDAASGADPRFGTGLTVAAFGSLSGALGRIFPNLECRVTQGTGGAEALLASGPAAQNQPFFFEPYACVGGCANGTGIPKSSGQPAPERQNFLVQSKQPAPSAIREFFRCLDAELDINDFMYEP
jgi:iron only hydrogenase large subunit-like protein